ncbi:MAG TPA: DUF3108 domain-containing protein [Anaeromyxobacter sp.]|nr:DUF3108 domain-containing protein [Anaeromyxobacter sp.]
MNGARVAFLLALVGPSAAAAPVARAQDFSPGEETVFTVSYLSVPTGEGRIRVGNAEGDIWPVILQARTSGAASLLDIREHLVSYWDVGRRLSRGSDLQAFEVGDFHTDSARFDRGASQVTVVEQRRGREKKLTVLAVPEGTLDLAGAFLWLRVQDLALGRQYEIPVVSGTSPFTLLAEVKSREVVKTPAGDFPSFKITVHSAFPGKFSTRRDSTLWLSESAGHHLVRASAEFAVGSVVAELKSYRPGGQETAAR